MCVQVWRETMVVLTHAHAARDALGPAQYEQYSRQRRNIVAQALRQAVGDQQVGRLACVLRISNSAWMRCSWFGTAESREGHLVANMPCHVLLG